MATADGPARRTRSCSHSAWDLDPIVDGEGSAGVERLLDEALARERQVRRARTRARSRRSTAPACARRCSSSPRSWSWSTAPAATRCCEFTTDTADPARGALLQKVQERGTALETQLLFFELEWAALDDEQAEALLDERRRPRVLRAPPAQRAPLPPAPALRARGEGDGGEEPGLERRLDAGCSASRSPRSASNLDGEETPLDPALSNLLSPDRERRRQHRRGGHRRARAGPAYARVHLQHAASTTSRSTTACAATRTGWRRATSPTRPPTSRCWR